MTDNLKKLDRVLMSPTAKTDFFDLYENDITFTNWLLGILPEVKDCQLQQQNNPWHVYNVLDHILVSVEHMASLAVDLSAKEKRLLGYVMFLHDIGKPETHGTRLNKEGVLVDSFYNHQIASKKIAQRVLPEFDFDNKEQQIIEKLILEHDYFMFLSRQENLDDKKLTQKAKENIQEFNHFGNGFKLNQMLVKIALSDNMAQNLALTKPNIELIKQYDRVSNQNFVDDKAL